MLVYRICPSKFAADISGTGAALYPGRWNKKGTPVLYTGENKEIALLETLVHIPTLIVPQLDMLTIDIPGDSITSLKTADLPKNWFSYPAPVFLTEISETWIREGLTLALKVPSCIIHSTHNYILNCNHRDYHHINVIKQVPFHLDMRLAGKNR